MFGAEKPSVLLVLTRQVSANPQSGRERTLASIDKALKRSFTTAYFVVPDIIRKPSLLGVLRVFLTLGRSVLQLRPTPLQVALFHGEPDFDRLLEAVRRSRAGAVYFDSVRTLDWMLAVRAAFPTLRIVCDFDDLLSARFSRLRQQRLPISLGYLAAAVPTPILDLLKHSFVTRALLLYEASALRRAERIAVETADAVAVVSTSELELLRADVGQDLAARTLTIPPVVEFPSASIRTLSCREFVFVGSDSLLQNRMSIDFLLGLWQRTAPARPLYIVGRMARQNIAVPRGVTFTGFVDDLSHIYTDDRVALCPSFVAGGVKTKVMEAIGHGVVVVGTAMTFDGLGCAAGSLAMTPDEMTQLVLQPEARLEILRQAALDLRACLHERFAFDAVSRAWMTTMVPADAMPIDLPR